MRSNNALGVCMSGSGPTVFGIFENKEDALTAKQSIINCVNVSDAVICTPVNKGCKIIDIVE